MRSMLLSPTILVISSSPSLIPRPASQARITVFYSLTLFSFAPSCILSQIQKSLP